jgi:hypothetical protein
MGMRVRECDCVFNAPSPLPQTLDGSDMAYRPNYNRQVNTPQHFAR